MGIASYRHSISLATFDTSYVLCRCLPDILLLCLHLCLHQQQTSSCRQLFLSTLFFQCCSLFCMQIFNKGYELQCSFIRLIIDHNLDLLSGFLTGNYSQYHEATFWCRLFRWEQTDIPLISFSCSSIRWFTSSSSIFSQSSKWWRKHISKFCRNREIHGMLLLDSIFLEHL